jgi:hypothetical protein
LKYKEHAKRRFSQPYHPYQAAIMIFFIITTGIGDPYLMVSRIGRRVKKKQLMSFYPYGSSVGLQHG